MPFVPLNPIQERLLRELTAFTSDKERSRFIENLPEKDETGNRHPYRMAYGELKQTTYIYDGRLTTDGLSYFEVKAAARAEAERIRREERSHNWKARVTSALVGGIAGAVLSFLVTRLS